MELGCVCERVALLIQHATRRHIAIYGLSGSTTLFDIFRRIVIKCKMCILIFSTTFILNISHFKKNSARRFHKCENVFMKSTRYSFRILMKLEFSRQIFEKHLNIKFHQNPLSGRQFFPCRRKDGRTDMKLIVTFRNFASAPKNVRYSLYPWPRILFTIFFV
jgi:hypothetical protein